MTIHISISDLEPKVKQLYLEDKIESLSIDYMPNAIMGWVGKEEIEVFNFSKVCKMDNRWTGYKLYENKTEIIVEIEGL